MALDSWAYNPANTTASALSGKQYIEATSGVKERFAPGSSDATRVFFVQWSQRAAFLDDLIGYSTLDGSSPKNILRVLPDPHPDYATFFAMSAEVEPWGPPGKSASVNSPDFTTAKITATYSHPDYDIVADADIITELDRYVTRGYGFAADYLTVQGRMQFCSRTNRDPLQISPAKLVCKEELTYVWHEIPCPPGVDDEASMEPPNLDNIQTCVGRVNNAMFDGYGAGTILFLGANPKMITPRLAVDGWYWEIEFKFTRMNNGAAIAGDTINAYAGHNYIYDQANNRWDLITSSGFTSGNMLYQFADLNSLFKISA